jgi:hypothetical protein
MTAFDLFFIAWLALVVAVLLCPCFARVIGFAALVLIALVVAARGAEIWAHEDYIVVRGRILHGDDEKFASSLRPETRVVRLFSPGGQIVASLKIGRNVRLQGLETMIEGQCDSGCAYIWMAGAPRRMAPDRRIGLHSAGTTLESGWRMRTDEGNRFLFQYLHWLNIPVRVMDLINQAEPHSMRYVDLAEAVELGLIPVEVDSSQQ